MNEKLVYTISETSRKLGISRNHAYKLAREGKLPGIITLGRRLVVSKAILDRLLEGR